MENQKEIKSFEDKLEDLYNGTDYKVLYSKQIQEISKMFLIMLPAERYGEFERMITRPRIHNICVFKLPDHAPNNYAVSVDTEIEIDDGEDIGEIISEIVSEVMSDFETRNI